MRQVKCVYLLAPWCLQIPFIPLVSSLLKLAHPDRGVEYWILNGDYRGTGERDARD
jgi:hypothetical protein